MKEIIRPERGYKKKTIAQTIERKINQWVKTIDDEELRIRVLNDYIVTGGAIASMLLGEMPNDYDVYFTNAKTCYDLATYYVSKLDDETRGRTVVRYRGSSIYDSTREISETEAVGVEIRIASAGIGGQCEGDNNVGYDFFELTPREQVITDSNNPAETYISKFVTEDKNKYQVSMITSNAISLTDDVQIITRFCGPVETIHLNYDFVHATNSYGQKKLTLRQEALEAILAKELRYVGSLYPVCSVFRMKKFLLRGWTITAGEMFKIAYDVSKLDLNDYYVLREQLTGVDTAYFAEILSQLEKARSGSDDHHLDRTYLFELVNRIFDEDFEEIVEAANVENV